MSSILSGLTSTHCFVHLDNIVIYARSLADHNTKLREVLDRLRTYRLKLQPDNWEYTWHGDYWVCVQPAQLPVLTWGSSSVPPGTTSTIRSPPGLDRAGYNNAATTNSRWQIQLCNISLSISFCQDKFVKLKQLEVTNLYTNRHNTTSTF